MSDDIDLTSYFERVGFSGSIAPNHETLAALHALHPAAIAFENLTPLIGDPVRLERLNLQQKLIYERRGGYCIEHNILFQWLLESLGYEVTPLAAKVLWGRPEGEDRPLTHMVLMVSAGGPSYLADVGFGAVTLTAPLRLRPDAEQETPHETFRLLSGAPGWWRLEVKIADEWRAVYAFEERPQDAVALSAMNDAVQADPAFRDNLIAARTGKGKRHVLRNLTLRLHQLGRPSETTTLRSVEELKTTLAQVFGIALPPAEKLDPALEALVARELPLLGAA